MNYEDKILNLGFNYDNLTKDKKEIIIHILKILEKRCFEFEGFLEDYDFLSLNDKTDCKIEFDKRFKTFK